MKILCHAQHLTGVGHFVRMSAIAEGLAGTHEVHLVDGGRPFPGQSRSDPAGRVRPVRLPRVARSEGSLVAVEPRLGIGDVLNTRIHALTRAIEAIRPDLVLIDHYPFSKWELEPELTASIETARSVNPRLAVLASLRDIVVQTRHERVTRAAWEQRVHAVLERHFDGILIHADPRFVELEDQLEVRSVPVPVTYTGFVGGFVPESVAASLPYAVVSAGGGAESLPFLIATLRAFEQLREDREYRDLGVIVFAGAFSSVSEISRLRCESRTELCDVRPFSADFARILSGAAVSVSRAGYNTCVRLLASNVRAVLVPDLDMSDQLERARRLAVRRLATLLEGDPPSATELAVAIRATLAAPKPVHDLDLAGVEGTRHAVEGVRPRAPRRT